MPKRKVDAPAAKIATMSRSELIRLLRQLRCTFELDFTDEFLESASLDRLRHIVLAATLFDPKAAARA